MSVMDCVDVYGLDTELLMMVPRPVFSLLLLFPITDKYEKFRLEEEEKIKKDGQAVGEDVYFTKQTVGNACGTVGIIHAIANNADTFTFKEGSVVKDFIDSTKSLSPEEKAKALEKHEGIAKCHSTSAQEGQTEAPPIDEKVNLHFLAFVEKNGVLYEMDGRKPFPINHGKTSEEGFLEDCAIVCKKFMNRDPDLLQFNMVALARKDF